MSEKSDIWLRRSFRFGLTGVLNFAFGYSLFAALFMAGLHPQTALVISFAIGVLWNFTIHGRYVFGKTGYRRLPGYILVYVFAYLVNRFGLSLAISYQISPLIAQLVLICITFVISFVGISVVLTGSVPFVGAINPRRDGQDSR